MQGVHRLCHWTNWSMPSPKRPPTTFLLKSTCFLMHTVLHYKNDNQGVNVSLNLLRPHKVSIGLVLPSLSFGDYPKWAQHFLGKTKWKGLILVGLDSSIVETTTKVNPPLNGDQISTNNLFLLSKILESDWHLNMENFRGRISPMNYFSIFFSKKGFVNFHFF
jgi:hypothetical protein